MKIGNHSFTQVEKIDGDLHGMIQVASKYDVSKSFHILNCESLESIEIGVWSFCDFGGDFELKQLNSLQSLQIGWNAYWSNNFLYGSFVIQGNMPKMVSEWLDLPNLQSIQIGCGAFAQSLSIKLESMK